MEDDHREIVDAETFHTSGTITVSPDEAAASIETDGDADTLVFRLNQGSDYVIAVRAGPSAGGRTLPHATVEHLRWSEDNLLQRRNGAVDQALLTEAAGVSAGEFLLRFTAPETAYYMLTVRGRSRRDRRLHGCGLRADPQRGVRQGPAGQHLDHRQAGKGTELRRASRPRHR